MPPFTTALRVTGSLATRLTTATLLMAILVGIPYGLLTQIGPPLPHRIPSPDQVSHALTQPPSDAAILTLLGLALWILWTAFTASVVVEVVAAVRGVPTPRLRPLAPMQTITGWLIAGLTASLLTAAPALSAAAHPQPAHAHTSTTGTPHTAAVPTTQTTIVISDRPAVADGTRPDLAPTTTVAATRHTPATRTPTYQVAHGDWLGSIAERFLGDFDRYGEIQDLNPHLIPHDAGPHGPDHIEPTWRLTLPSDADDRGPQPHATGPVLRPNPDTTDPANGTPHPDTPTAPTTPAPDDGVTTPDTGPDTPTPSTSATGNATPSAATATPTAAADPHPSNTAKPDHDDGVPLPGGWTGIPLAAALVAAAAMVWQRRRHHHVYRPINNNPGDTDEDPDLRPLPPVITRLRHAVREQAPELLDPPPARLPTVTEYTTTEPRHRADLPPVGPTGLDLAGLADDVPASGLGLIGPGAEPAARAMLVATLSSGTPNDPDARGHAVIPADTLTTLLGAVAIDLRTLPRLSVTADLPEALTQVEELLIERRRLLQEYETTDLDTLRATDPFHPPTPPVLLVSETPPPQLRTRLTTTLRLGSPLQISAVILGDWPHGDTLTVLPDGHTTGTKRLAVLDAPTTRQLLTVIHDAHTGRPAAAPTDTPPTGANRTPPPPAPAPNPSDTTRTHPDPDPPPPNTTAADTTSGPAPTPPTQTGPTTPDKPPTPDQHPNRPRPVHIRLLGQPAIFDHHGNPVPGLRHHARELLVYLAVHRAGANLSDIMEAFWPNATVRRAGERLSTEAGDLRRRIRQAADNTGIQPIVNTGSRYHLDPNLLDVDIWHLTDALRRATATTNPAEQVAALRQAVDADTGILAEGYNYDWIEQPREQVRRHGIRARLHLAQHLSGTDPHTAAQLTHDAAELDPLNEDIARKTMQALAAIGDTNGIRDRLHRLRDALDHIDEEPSSDITALAAQLQAEAESSGTKPSSPPTEPTATSRAVSA